VPDIRKRLLTNVGSPEAELIEYDHSEASESPPEDTVELSALDVACAAVNYASGKV
jgi:hypothetical protein